MLKGSAFVKNSSYMVMSTIVMQVIAIATIPFLSRVFSPEIFGYHATFRSSIVLLSIVITLKLDTAVVLPKNAVERQLTFVGAIEVTVALAILALVVLLALAVVGLDPVNWLFGRSSILLLITVVFGALLVGVTSIQQAMLVGQGYFRQLALSRVVLPASFFLVALSFIGSSNYWLALVISQSVAYAVLFVYLWKASGRAIKRISGIAWRKTIDTYSDIAKYTTSVSFVNAMSVNMPGMLLLSLYGAEFLGLYAIGAKIISMPTQFIGASFSQVFYKKAVDLYNDSPQLLYPFVKKVTIALLLIGVIVFTIAYIIVPVAVPFFLGEDWSAAIILMQYLCIWQALVIVNSPLSTLTIILNKQKPFLIAQVVFLFARCGALIIPFWMSGDGSVAILSYAITGFVFNAAFLAFFILIVQRVGRSIAIEAS